MSCRVKYFLLSLLAFSLPCPSYPFDLLTERLDLNCNQSDGEILACSYRPLGNLQITGINASLDNRPVELLTRMTYPFADSVTAILFLVDTSDPGRQDVIIKNAAQIEKMLNAIQPHHIFGLANFDKELVVNVAFGTDKNSVISSARSLQASGLTTELYRNTLEAVELLGRVNADRKVLFLFSDGQAEDKAYFHEDVINISRRNGVIINSLGFPRSTPLSVALQTLRRLSQETGGVYIESDPNFDIPGTFLSEPYANVDRGGHLVTDLSTVESPVPDDPRVLVRFETAAGNIPVEVPVRLTRQPVITRETALATPPAAAPVQTPVVIQAAQEEMGYIDFLLWYGVPIALLVLIILTLLSLYLLFRKQKVEDQDRRISYAEIKPLAYLITQDEKAKSYPVTSSTWRIGRSMDNEMTIPDSSISRRHAEIQRETNGQFVVYDRGSTNGVYVNNHKVSRHLLNEGDIIEIGDVFLRFTQKPGDSQLGETTAMLRTRAPEFN